MTDNRAVSATLGYVMVIGITTVLISGLFIAAGGFVENQHERAIRAELEVIGNRMAADIAAVDRLALAAGSSGETELEVNLPPRTAGKSYDIEISQVAGSPNTYHLNLSTSNPSVFVEVRVRTKTTLVSATVSGGDVVIDYDGSDLEVRNA